MTTKTTHHRLTLWVTMSTPPHLNRVAYREARLGRGRVTIRKVKGTWVLTYLPEADDPQRAHEFRFPTLAAAQEASVEAQFHRDPRAFFAGTPGNV